MTLKGGNRTIEEEDNTDDEDVNRCKSFGDLGPAEGIAGLILNSAILLELRFDVGFLFSVEEAGVVRRVREKHKRHEADKDRDGTP